MNIQTGDYKEAILNALSAKQIEVLKLLYSFPDSTATSLEMAAVMNPCNPANVVASGAVGKTGKAIATYLNVTPQMYYDGRVEKPAYFSVIGPYFQEGPNGERAGWEMNEKLIEALEELGMVSKSSINEL